MKSSENTRLENCLDSEINKIMLAYWINIYYRY